jgi:hypothetical protein
MTARLDRSSIVVGVASSGAPTPRSAPMAAAWVGAPPPGAESA